MTGSHCSIGPVCVGMTNALHTVDGAASSIVVVATVATAVTVNTEMTVFLVAAAVATVPDEWSRRTAISSVDRSSSQSLGTGERCDNTRDGFGEERGEESWCQDLRPFTVCCCTDNSQSQTANGILPPTIVRGVLYSISSL